MMIDNNTTNIAKVCIVRWSATDETNLMYTVNNAIDMLPEDTIVRDVKLYPDEFGTTAMILWQWMID